MSSSASSPRVGTQWNVQSPYTYGFVSPATLHDRPDVNRRLFDYDYSSLFDFMIASGSMKITGNKEYYHGEQDNLWHTHTVESKSGSAGAGNKATITLEEVDHLDDATANNLSTPQEGDIAFVFTSTGLIKAYVSDVNKATPDAHTVELDPLDDTVDLVTAVAAGDKVTVISNAYGDGTDQPYAKSRLPVPYSNYVQIFKGQSKTDGQKAATVSYFDAETGSQYYYNQLVKDSYLEMKVAMANALIFGFKNSKPDPRDTTKTAYMTGGLEWYADQYGYLEPYSTSFGLTDLENVRKCLDLERQSSKILLLAGADLNAQIDEFVKGRLDNTAVDWSAMGVGSAAGRMVDFGIDGFRYGNFTFMKQKFDNLNNMGQTGGITGSPYPGQGYFLPWGVFKGSDGKDMDGASVRYMQGDQGSRYMQFWTRSKKETNIDAFEFNHLCEAGLEIGFPRHIVKTQAA